MASAVTLPSDFRCGYFDCSVFGDLTTSPVRTRTVFEIEFYLENGKRTFSNGETFPIRRHHILIGRPGEAYNSELPFKTKFLKLEADGILARELSALPSYFQTLHPYEIEQCFDRLIALKTQSSECSSVALSSALLSLLSAIISDGTGAAVAEGSDTLFAERAKEFIRTHQKEQLHLSDIAAAVNLSPSYFHSLFTSVTGETPHSYLLSCRLASAKEMLCATSLTIDEIARLCGFGSQQYMSNVFRARLGISPGKCRRTYRESYLQ